MTLGMKSWRQVLAVLFGNWKFLCIYSAIWFSLLLGIYYLWDVSIKVKILVTLPLIPLTPSLGDVVEAWRRRKR